MSVCMCVRDLYEKIPYIYKQLFLSFRLKTV